MPQTTTLDLASTINEIVALHPQTIPVFNEFGFDTCCGGGITVPEAARRDGINLAVVLTALNEALANA